MGLISDTSILCSSSKVADLNLKTASGFPPSFFLSCSVSVINPKILSSVVLGLIVRILTFKILDNSEPINPLGFLYNSISICFFNLLNFLLVSLALIIEFL